MNLSNVVQWPKQSSSRNTVTVCPSMNRQIHWTQDPRFSHLRNQPAWYQIRPTPFYTPRPSAIMEKRAAEERKRQWQWQIADGAREAVNITSCLAATFWPCGIYSRTSQRLKAALSGHDTELVPNRGCCNPDCVQFGLCLPFYGCLLAKLQTTVRTFYGIDGTDFSDWYDAFCCPCLTMIRNEQEILLREKQHRKLKGRHNHDQSSTRQYHSQTPMTYLSPDSCKSTNTQAQRKNASHQLSSDALSPANTAAYPQVHYLDHD